MAEIPAKYNSDCSFVIEGHSKDSKAKVKGAKQGIPAVSNWVESS